MNTKLQIFLDMDGVIADFVGAIHKAHGREYCYSDLAVRGQFEIPPIWGCTAEEFWKPDSSEFWDSIEPMPDAGEIVSILSGLIDSSEIAVLTSPSDGSGCVPGKRAWIKRYFPQLQKNMIFTSAKQFLAGPDKLLVDDRDKNVADFRKYGGQAILIPRHWNSLHHKSERVIHHLKDEIMMEVFGI